MGGVRQEAGSQRRAAETPAADWLLSAVLMREIVAFIAPRAAFCCSHGYRDYRVWLLGSRLELEYDSQTARTDPGRCV